MMDLLGIGSDISKVRSRLGANLEVLERPEAQEKINSFLIQCFEEDLQIQSDELSSQDMLKLLVWSISYLPLLSTFINISKRIVRRPFRVTCVDVCLVELLFSLENDETASIDPYLQKLFTRQFIIRLEDICGFEVGKLWGRKIPASFLRKTFAETDEADPDYPLFFTYTLRQTSVFDLELFLSYRKRLYKGDFYKFLKRILLDDKGRGLISPQQRSICKQWLKAAKPPQKQRTSRFPSPARPANWIEVPGLLKEEQLVRFFSFLYLEKDASGNSLLTQAETEHLFRYGFAYPQDPEPKQMITLNFNTRLPKKLVYHMFFKLQEAHRPHYVPADYKKHFAGFLKHHFSNFAATDLNTLRNSLRNYPELNTRGRRLDISYYLPIKSRKEFSIPSRL